MNGQYKRRKVQQTKGSLVILWFVTAVIAAVSLQQAMGNEPPPPPLPSAQQQPAPDREGLLAEIRAAAADDEADDGYELPVASVDVGFLSKYVWRGIVITDDPVFQPSVNVDWLGLSLNIWGNLDLTGINDNRGDFNEVDFTLSYTKAFGPVEAGVGVVHYWFPNTAFPQTTELFATMALPDVPLTPSITAWFDVDEADGWYVSSDISHSLELPKLCGRFDWSLDASAGFGWASANHNNFYFGVNRSGWTDFHAALSAPVKLTHWLTAAPSISYTSLLDSQLRGAVADADNVVFGITFSVLF